VFDRPCRSCLELGGLIGFETATYDVTIKIEHLLKYKEHLPTLRDTGCLFVISAVESLDDAC